MNNKSFEKCVQFYVVVDTFWFFYLMAGDTKKWKESKYSGPFMKKSWSLKYHQPAFIHCQSIVQLF